MRHLLTILTLCSISCFGQNKEFNPFESIGKPGKIVTLSNGRYTEVHINDSLQRIGSVIVNMNTGKIYEVLKTDTLYNESNLDPTVITRWYSIDPLIKAHESPYASMANNPIWCIDPNGADSALASGGTTWQWHVETGDTYNEISKRTGVSVENLRTWNEYEDTKIPVNAMLHISDPTATPPAKTPGIQVTDGTIEVYKYNSDDTETGDRQDVGLGFIPNSTHSGDTYVWFQTFETNDPKPASGVWDANRTLSPTVIPGNDVDAGMRAGYSSYGKSFSDGSRWLPSTTSIPFLDRPSRPHRTGTGTTSWGGTLCLYKKVDETYVKVAAFSYSFEITNQHITPGVFRFNPIVDPTDSGIINHQNEFKEWDETH